MAGSAGERVGADPGPVKGITGAVLCLIVLFTDSVDLDAAFLSADQGCSGAYGLLLLNNASVSCALLSTDFTGNVYGTPPTVETIKSPAASSVANEVQEPPTTADPFVRVIVPADIMNP